MTIRPYPRPTMPGQHRAVAEEDAVRVDRHHAPPLLVRHLDGGQRGAGDAGRADEDVDRAELGGRPRDGRVDLGRVGDVALQRERAVGRSAVEVERRDPRALGEQALGGRRADAARASGDERDATREPIVDRSRHGDYPNFCAMAFDPVTDYPLGSRRPGPRPDADGTRAGRRDARRGASRRARAPPTRARRAETLGRQAEVARAAGRTQLADGLERAAELTDVADDELLAIYTALRPGRSTAERARALGRAARRARRGAERRVRPRGGRRLRRAQPAGPWLRRRAADASSRAKAPSSGASCSSSRGPSSASSPPTARPTRARARGRERRRDAPRRPGGGRVRRDRPVSRRARARPRGRGRGDGAAGRAPRPDAGRRRRARARSSSASRAA